MNTNHILIDDKELCIPPLGFLNTASICYFNSLVQCLLSSTHFLQFIIDTKEKENGFFYQFLEFIIQNKWDTIFTTRLLQKYNMIQPNQSASEYFIFLVDLLKLEPIFECRYKLDTVCTSCEYKKEIHDKSYNILINNDFSEFFQYKETIDGVKCDGCKQPCTIIRSHTILGLPPIIAISFNKYFSKRKINYPISFRTDEINYRLIGTIEHSGVLGGGHYIARVFRNEKYYVADDSRVYEIQNIDVSENTYMIFYERV